MPPGIFVGMEDMLNLGDESYYDDQFVLTRTSDSSMGATPVHLHSFSHEEVLSKQQPITKFSKLTQEAVKAFVAESALRHNQSIPINFQRHSMRHKLAPFL